MSSVMISLGGAVANNACDKLGCRGWRDYWRWEGLVGWSRGLVGWQRDRVMDAPWLRAGVRGLEVRRWSKCETDPIRGGQRGSRRGDDGELDA